MKIAEVKVAKTTCETTLLVPIPKGIVGATISIEYTDPAWDGLQKTVVFRSSVTKDVLASGNEVVIPAEVVSRAGRNLYMGVYGVDIANNVVIPTIWAELGMIHSAADPSGDSSSYPLLPVWAQIQAMIGNLDELDTETKNNLVVAVNEALRKGGGTVDAAEIQRIVDAYLVANPPEVTENDPTVPPWAKQPQKPTYTATEVGADPAGTAASAVSQHNTDAAAHNDLRLALQELANRINAALDSDDTTLDQMSEIVAYIKSNKTLIDAITTSKVSVADIVNDLVTNVADKPLSAAQGVALKGLIEELRALIPEAYTLPIATEDTLGGVKPVTATEAMTQPVGVTAEGRLVTKPGEGGSGISVTGATVGQTVKIAAVDDNGVPTQWEPVDFPSGGGEKWEKIADITLQEEVGNVVIDKDMEGNAFLLKAFYVLVDSKVPTGTAFTRIKTVVNGYKTISNNATQNETDKNRYYYCYAKHIPDVGALCWTGCSVMPYNNHTDMQQMLRGYNSIYKEGGFYNLTIAPNDGNAMLGGVGTTIMVWGVRA